MATGNMNRISLCVPDVFKPAREHLEVLIKLLSIKKSDSKVIKWRRK